MASWATCTLPDPVRDPRVNRVPVFPSLELFVLPLTEDSLPARRLGIEGSIDCVGCEGIDSDHLGR